MCGPLVQAIKRTQRAVRTGWPAWKGHWRPGRFHFSAELTTLFTEPPGFGGGLDCAESGQGRPGLQGGWLRSSCRLCPAWVWSLCNLPSSLSSRRGLSSLRRQLLQAGEKEARPLHQGAIKRTRTGIRYKQIHYQGQTEAYISHDKSLRAAGYNLVPEQEGQREKSHQQTEDH